MPIPKSPPKKAPPCFPPRVEAHERRDRFVFIHECVNHTKRTTVLPVGRSSWTWDPEAGTVSPSIHCESCGTHGYWESGEWRPA